MRKFKGILILIIILILMPSFSNNIVEAQKIDTLKFKDLENLIIKNNPTVKINDNTKNNLLDAIEDIKDASLDKRVLERAIDKMDEAIDGMNKAVKGQEQMINQLRGMQAIPNTPKKEMTKFTSGFEDINSKFNEVDEKFNEVDEKFQEVDEKFQEVDEKFQEVDGDLTKQNLVNSTLYTSQILALQSVKGLYEANVSSLEQNRDSMKDQLKEFEKLPIREMELEKAIFQIDMGNQSIIWGGQNLYLAHNTLKSNRDDLVQSLKLLNSQIDIMKVQEDLGMITSLDIKTMRSQREEIEFAIKSLEIQMDNILGDLNMILGQDYNRSLILEDSFKLDKTFLFKMNYTNDKKLAKNNSYSIKLKDFDYNIQYDNMLWENKHRNYDAIVKAKRDVENAKIGLDQEGKNLDLVFSKAYKEVKNKVAELDKENKKLGYEEEKLNMTQLKYDLGMISRMEFEDSKSKYDSQKSKVTSLEQDIFQKLLQYKALLKGINFFQ